MMIEGCCKLFQVVVLGLIMMSCSTPVVTTEVTAPKQQAMTNSTRSNPYCLDKTFIQAFSPKETLYVGPKGIIEFSGTKGKDELLKFLMQRGYTQLTQERLKSGTSGFGGLHIQVNLDDSTQCITNTSAAGALGATYTCAPHDFSVKGSGPHCSSYTHLEELSL